MSTTDMSTVAPECKDNISSAGRRIRMRFGTLWLGISGVLLLGLVALKAPWYWRLLLFVPTTL